MMMNMTQTQNKSQYELSRDERIKANLERMQKLGLADISLDLRSQFQAKKGPKRSYSKTTSSSGASTIRKPGPVRRSSRLQNSSPVSYTEVPVGKKDEGMKMGSIMLEEGAKPEIYTEEHEKLLGHTEKSWTLFEDGYGKDGKRIYDPVRGKTCHQCRQKTLGYRTQCSQCNKIHGQFCGDCLYMRYGENVLEAIENPKWICPVCRGICNCSFCRTAKGWPPTGLLYRKIKQRGFKSVAHYLIQTRRAETSLVQTPETPEQVSARSLPIPDMDEENLKADFNDLGPLTCLGEQKGDNEFKSEKEDEKQNNADLDINNQTSAKRTLSFPEIDHMVGDPLELPKFQSESSTNNHKEEEKIKMDCVDTKLGDSTNGLETTSMSKKKRARNYEPSADSIGGRLRRRRQKEAEHDDDASKAKEKIPDGKQDANKILSEKEVKKEICVLFTDNKDGGDSSTVLRGRSKLRKKRIVVAEPSADSIAGRLRQRRKGN
ncbi:hypothetical protein ACLB2K_005906 [Fragaria x ananassa]